MFNNPAPSLYEFFLLNWIFKKSIPKVEPRPGVELGQAVLQVLGAGLVTLLSMNRGPSHPPGKPLCSQQAGLATPPTTPWLLCSLMAPKGGLPSPLVLPSPASSREAKLCLVMVFTQHLRP